MDFKSVGFKVWGVHGTNVAGDQLLMVFSDQYSCSYRQYFVFLSIERFLRNSISKNFKRITEVKRIKK